MNLYALPLHLIHTAIAMRIIKAKNLLMILYNVIVTVLFNCNVMIKTYRTIRGNTFLASGARRSL